MSYPVQSSPDVPAGSRLPCPVPEIAGRWWVIQAKRDQCREGEYRLASDLLNWGLTPYIPSVKYKLVRTKEVVEKPILLGYVFVATQADDPTDSREEIYDATDRDFKTHRRILTAPVSIPNQKKVIRELSALQEAIGADLIKGGGREIQPGTLVEIRQGPFKYCRARVDRTNPDAAVVLLIVETLGREVPIEIPLGYVEPL